jgi:hypothetical protein
MEYSRQLRAGWFRGGRRCYYCGHPFAAPHLIEVGHIISWRLRPDLAWSRDNLAPVHGPSKRAGDKRCPETGCNLNCNWIAHNTPDAPRRQDGTSLPFTPEFLARAQAERVSFLRKPALKPVTVRGTPRKPAESRPLTVPFRPADRDTGRPW